MFNLYIKFIFSFKVISILYTLLDQRVVKFTSLTIIIHEGECTEDNDGEMEREKCRTH